MKRLLLAMFALAAFSMSFAMTSCNDDSSDEAINPNPTDLSVAIAPGETTTESVTASFTPSEEVASYVVAIGKLADIAAFEAGTLDGIETLTGAQTKTFENLDSNVEYVVFARGADDKGNKGTTAMAGFTTADMQLSVVIAAGTITEKAVTATFTPGADVTTMSVAIGKAEDRYAFENGTLEGIVPLTEAGDYTFEGLTESTEYVIFAQGASEAGVKGAVAMATATTLVNIYAIDLTVNTINAVYADLTIAPRSGVASFAALSASAEVWEMMCPTEADAIEMIQLYVDYGLGAIEGTTSAVNATVGLSGYPSYQSLLAVLTTDADGGLHYSTYPYKSPDFEDLLGPDLLKVTLTGSDATSATFSYTMGENTVAYYYQLMYQSEYQQQYDSGVSNGYGGSLQVRDYIAFYGYVGTENMTGDKWSNLDSGTDFVMGAIPTNANGAGGYGELVIVPFTTAAAGPSGAAVPSFKSAPLKYNGSKVYKSILDANQVPFK